MATFHNDARTQVIYLANEIGAIGYTGGLVSSLALEVVGPPELTMENWTIRMQHTELSAFDTVEWTATGWTTVYQADVTITSPGWVTFEFTTPFDYNGVDHLMVDLSFNNVTNSEPEGFCRYFDPGGRKRVLYKGYSSGGSGNPLNWSGVSPPPILIEKIPQVRLTLDNVSHIAPVRTSPFIDGVWNGSVSILDDGSGIRLRADDGYGREGYSAPVEVRPGTRRPTRAPDEWILYR